MRNCGCSVFDTLVSGFHPTQVLFLEGLYLFCGTERAVSQHYYKYSALLREPFHHTVPIGLIPIGNKALIVPL